MARLLAALLLATSCSSVGPDVWVDVQGARGHARGVGPRFAPVVVLDGGAGQDLRAWKGVVDELSKEAYSFTDSWIVKGYIGQGNRRIAHMNFTAFLSLRMK